MSSTATPSDRGRGKPRQRKDGNHDGGGSGREAPGSGSGKEGGRGRGGRGRGSRGGSSRGAGRSPGSMSQKPKKREFFDGVEDSTALETLDKPTEDVTEEDIEITDLSYVGSYSWVERDKPTIIVPGE